MINKFKSYIFTLPLQKNRSVLIYTLMKYFEYFINAYLFFSVAKNVNPVQFGNSTSAFLTITYSSFIVLGVNQVLVKWYSKSNDDIFKVFLIKYSIIYNIIFAGFAFFLIHFFIGNRYGLSISIICSFRLIIECIVTIFRVKNRIFYINYIYLIVAFSFLFLYKLFVSDMHSFFNVWAISIFAGLIFSIILALYCHQKVIKLTLIEFKHYFLTNNSELFRDGVKLTVISIISTIILSIDRVFFVNWLKIEKIKLGNIQLADNIANVISLGFGSILFILTPKLIELIHEKKLTVGKFYQYGSFFFAILLVLSFFYVPLVWFLEYIYPQYHLVGNILPIYLLIKIFNLYLFIPSVLSMSNSSEKIYIKISSFWIGILLIIFYIIGSSARHLDYFYFLPLSILSILIFMNINFWVVYKRDI